MKKVIFNKKRMSVQLQRLLMMMATIMMAFATLTACDILEDNNDEGDKEEEGGNGGGGVSGKRLKSYIVSSPENTIRSEYSYNSDGTLKRTDNYYHESSKLIQYVIYTNNSDGTVAKQEQYIEGYSLITVWNFTNDSNKKPLKRQGTSSMDGVTMGSSIVDYTFQNGRKTREVVKDYSGTVMQSETQYEFNYGSNGRRTTTVQTINGKSTQYTRTYNSDGTLQKVISPSTTITFTWENAKPPHDFDDYAQF